MTRWSRVCMDNPRASAGPPRTTGARAVFFAGELVFEQPQWYHRILHNETAYAILRQIRFAGLPMVILPIRIREKL